MKYFIISLFTLTVLIAKGQNPYQAPLNPDFLKQKEKKGYVHPPLKRTHNGLYHKDASILPEQYDLRDVDGNNYIPAIRNQSPHGTCWTFAALASVESNWKKSGDQAFTDLSEANMAKCHGYEFDIDSGGNEYMSTAYLTRLAGPLYESEDPYENIADRQCFTVDKNTQIPAYIDNVLWLGNDRDNIKKTIMKYGAVATSMNSNFSADYYNPTDYTFYYNGTSNVDHGIAIIGWDDHKVVTGGSKGTPQQPGAWIIRNSWGTSAQNNGYFYASYEDVHIGKDCEAYYGKTPVNQVDTLLDYAKLGAISAHSAGNMNNTYGYAALKHHSNKDLFITHIGSAIIDEGTELDISICRQFDGHSFSDTLAHQSSIMCTYAGYKKIEFPCLVEAGDFYVIIKYTTPNSPFSIPAELVVEGYANPTIEENVMWISADGSEWTQGGKNTRFNFDLPARVYAKYINGLQAYFTNSKNQVCLDQEVTFYNNTIGEADSFIWEVDMQKYITENLSETLSYTFNTTGIKSVTLSAYKDGIPSVLTKTNAIEIVSEIEASIIITEPADYYSKGNPITLLASGGDSYTWNAEAYLDNISGSKITISPDVEELWVYLDATMGNCYNRDSVLLKMIDVPYDNIANALTLTIGNTVSNISNQYASVEAKEPMPPTGSCSSQNTWCEEGGLHNSLWFKFEAPASGRIIIDTHGFDNQIALYDAVATGTWQDILSGDSTQYTILAANDDYYDSDYAAKIEEVSNLTPQKTYWIQMDGSGGGATGVANITIENPITVIDNSKEDLDLKIINTNKQCIIKGDRLKDSQIRIFRSTGECIYSSSIAALPHLVNKDFTPGFYIIHIQNEHIQHTLKSIAQQDWHLRIETK